MAYDPTQEARFAVMHGVLSSIFSRALSAGGISAVFLAKALSRNNKDLARLRQMWLTAADIDTLLNDRNSDLGKYPGRFFNLVMRAITWLPFHDTQCGFKLFEAAAAKEIFRRQQLDGFGFDVEDLFIARRLGYRVIETPVRWNDVKGTKVSAFSGLKAFLDPLRIRWHQARGRYR